MKQPISKVCLLIKPWAYWLLFAGITAIMVSLIEQLIPLEVRTVINLFLKPSPPRSTLVHSVCILCALMLGSQVLQIAQRLVTERVSTRLGARLFETGTAHLLSNPMDWFIGNHSGALQVRLERSTRAISELVRMVLSDVLAPTVGLFLAAVLIWRSDALVGLVVVGTIPAMVGLTIWQAKSQAGIRVAINSAREEQGVRVIEAVEGIEQVKLFRAEGMETARSGAAAEYLGNTEFTHHVAMARFDLAKFIIDRGGFAVVLLVGLKAGTAHGSSLGIGGVFMLLMLYERMAEPIRHLHRIIDEMSEKWVLSKDYLRIMDVDRVTRAPHSTIPQGPPMIQCMGATFTYPGTEKPILVDVNFIVRAGSKVALMGASGSGKSTMAKLIAGLHPLTSGEIRIGGQPVQPIEKQENKPLVGMLSQEIYLFKGTIADNIRYGAPQATDADVRRAAEVARISDVIESLPEGYNTVLGQRGNRFSGGQKQRLALARVVLQDPDVIVFDEPSASLDPENAAHFFDNVLRVFHEKTVLVITHDDRRLEWADSLLVFDGGKVTQQDHDRYVSPVSLHCRHLAPSLH